VDSSRFFILFSLSLSSPLAINKSVPFIQLTEAGLLKAPIAKTFAFEDFVAANLYMETCPAGGRVVMKVGVDG
jgi:NADPH:quinone reductase-like Zn-dependent oxidoreductase